jgi:hypothetical protein
MFFIIYIRKAVFGTRFASFQFGWSHEIRAIRTDKNGDDFAWAYGTRIDIGSNDWKEI